MGPEQSLGLVQPILLAEESNADMSILEGLIGIDIPDYVLWIALGVIVLIVIIIIAVGFFKELGKK